MKALVEKTRPNNRTLNQKRATPKQDPNAKAEKVTLDLSPPSLLQQFMLFTLRSKSKPNNYPSEMIPIQSNRSGVQAAAAQVSNMAASAAAVDTGPSLMELLSNSADELTQSLSGRAQEKKLKERKQAEARPDGLGPEAVSQLLEAMAQERQAGSGDDAKQQIERDARDLARKLLNNPGLARKHSREGGDSSTEQYLLLLEVAERLAAGDYGADPGGRAHAAAREAAAELYAERGREIHADLNTFPALNPLGSDAQAIRSDYRDIVFGEATVADFMRKLLERIPDNQPEKFAATLDATRDAAGLDLAAARPSGDPVRLQALVTDLNHMKVIGTVIEKCSELSQVLVARHGLDPAPSATRMTRELVSVTGDRWVDGSRFSKISQDLGVHDPAAASVHFLTGARSALRDLPPQIFVSPEARETILDAAQAALDHAIDRDEGFV